jgi:hypothetical protein
MINTTARLITTLAQLNTTGATITKDGIVTTVEWPVVEHLSRSDAHTYLATTQIFAIQIGDKPFLIKAGQVYKEKFFVNDEGKTILKHRDLTEKEFSDIIA